MDKKKESSFDRVVKVYRALKEDGSVQADNQSAELGKHEETVKRYIRHIKSLADLDGGEVVYRKEQNLYVLKQRQEHVYHIWLLSTMLYGSRSLNAEEIGMLIDFISKPFSREYLKPVRQLVSSYSYHYKPMTSVPLIGVLRELYAGITKQTVLRMTYRDHNRIVTTHDITPFSVCYDQGYFYVTADSLTEPDKGTWNYRLDRIQSLSPTRQTFAVRQSGADYFKPGEHANMSFLMHSGDRKLRVLLKLEPWLVSYMKEQFPIHEFVGRDGNDELYDVTVMNEDSVMFWVLKQRTWAEVLEPASLRLKMREVLQSMMSLYE